MPSYDLTTRAQILTLYLNNVPPVQIVKTFGCNRDYPRDLLKKAKANGFDPDVSPIIRDAYLTDKKKSGRPTKQTDIVKEKITAIVSKNRKGREKTYDQIAIEVGGVSGTTIWRILRALGYRKTKPTRKPGLTEEMRNISYIVLNFKITNLFLRHERCG